jgi:hypothetical protein
MINNRKLAARRDGKPCGFEFNNNEGIFELIYENSLYIEAGVKYNIRVRARSAVNAVLKYRVKSRYFKVFSEGTMTFTSGITTVENSFTLFLPKQKLCLKSLIRITPESKFCLFP